MSPNGPSDCFPFTERVEVRFVDGASVTDPYPRLGPLFIRILHPLPTAVSRIIRFPLPVKLNYAYCTMQKYIIKAIYAYKI